MSSMACWRVLLSVSKDASYRVTGREVSDMMLLSAVRRTVRRFSQFCKQTQTRERVAIAIATCEIIIWFVPIWIIHVIATCKNNTICKFTWQMWRSPLKEDCLRCFLHFFTVRQIQTTTAETVRRSRNAAVSTWATWHMHTIPHVMKYLMCEYMYNHA